MVGHSRSKNGVASLAYAPAIHDLFSARKTWMPGTRPGMTIPNAAARGYSILEQFTDYLNQKGFPAV